MFGHLKTSDFMDLLEGGNAPHQRRYHLERCERCASTLKSLESVYSKVVTIDEDIMEPDWSDFRASVRDQMLSRSVQRQMAVRGRFLKPAAVWALSGVLCAGAAAGALFWP